MASTSRLPRGFQPGIVQHRVATTLRAKARRAGVGAAHGGLQLAPARGPRLRCLHRPRTDRRRAPVQRENFGERVAGPASASRRWRWREWRRHPSFQPPAKALVGCRGRGSADALLIPPTTRSHWAGRQAGRSACGSEGAAAQYRGPAAFCSVASRTLKRAPPLAASIKPGVSTYFEASPFKMADVVFPGRIG